MVFKTSHLRGLLFLPYLSLMYAFLQKRWVLLLTLIVFIALKIPHLSYPFYWDESWPYASGVKHMLVNGPSLMPGAIDGELSRGHPLMFHFLASLWMKLFGTSNFVMHTFPLFIAVLFMIAIYEAGLSLFDKRVAITALLLISFQQLFFVQSSFVLLEMMLAFLGFISVYFYVKKKYLLTAIALTMLYYTKESGMIVGLVLGIDAIIGLFNKQKAVKDKLYGLVSLGVPVIAIAIFFIIQKQVSGWYVLPLYSNGLETSLETYYEKIRSGCKVCFRDDLRKYYFVGLVLMSLVAAVKNKSLKMVCMLIAVPIVSLLCSDGYHWLLPNYVTVILLPVVLLSVVYMMFRVVPYTNTLQKRFVLLLTWVIIVFFYYCAINMFFIDRYLQLAFVPVLFIAAIYTTVIVNKINPKLYAPVLLAMLCIEAYAYKKDTSLGDIKLGAFDGMYVQKDLMDFVENENLHNKNISIFENLQYLHLTDSTTGFKTTHKPFPYVQWGTNYKTEVIMIENIEMKTAKDTFLKVSKDTSFRLAHKVERGLAWGAVFIKKDVRN